MPPSIYPLILYLPFRIWDKYLSQISFKINQKQYLGETLRQFGKQIKKNL